MPTYKCTMFLASQDNEGWTDNFYLSDTDIDAAVTEFDGFITDRLPLMGPAFSILWARVSDVAVKGDVAILPRTFPLDGTGTPTSGATPLEANTALKITVTATAVIHNRHFFRGLYSDTVDGRVYAAPSWFATAMATWLTRLKTHTFCRHRTAVGPPPTYSYTAATQADLRGPSARKPGRPFGLPVGAHRRGP